MAISIRDNTLARHIAKRRWVRRLNWFSLPQQAYVTSHARKFYVDLGDWRGPSYHVLNWGIESYEPGNRQFLEQCLNETPNGVMFDIGANIGIFPFQLAARFPDLTVHTFEPDQTTFACLSRTFTKTAFPNVQTHQMALSDKKGQSTFFADASNHGGHSLNAQAIADEGNAVAHQMTVQTDTLDGFFSAQGLKRLDLIKLDVQRHESEVLSKAGNTIRNCRPIVLMECYFAELLEENSKLLSPFLGNGYVIVDPSSRREYALDPGTLTSLREGGREYCDLAFIPTEKTAFLKRH